jgi:hypothetical protein
VPLREQVARALVNKGVTLGELGRSEEEIGVYEEVVARFGAAAELPLREQVARALGNKGARSGRSAGARRQSASMTRWSPALARRGVGKPDSDF